MPNGLYRGKEGRLPKCKWHRPTRQDGRLPLKLQEGVTRDRVGFTYVGNVEKVLYACGVNIEGIVQFWRDSLKCSLEELRRICLLLHCFEHVKCMVKVLRDPDIRYWVPARGPR